MTDMIWMALTANGNSFADNALVALNVTVVGMVTIFAVLALLWGIIELLHRILNAGEKAAKDAAAPQALPAVPAVSMVSPAVQIADDGALIAVITAAVSAAMAEEGYTGGFRVVAFRRVFQRGQSRF